MTDLLAQVTLNHKSGLPKDAFQMGFVVHHEDPIGSIDAGEMTALQNAIQGFFNVNTGASGTVESFMSKEFVRTSVPVKYYDLTGKLQATLNANGKMQPPNHGSPVSQGAMVLNAAPGSVGLPGEVALVLTLRARGALDRPIEAADGPDPLGAVDRPRQRSSGRLFLGPLNVAAVVSGTNDVPRPSSFLIDAVTKSAETMQEALNFAGWTWCVWSRVEGTVRAVTSVEVDDAFDTQRRRGAAPGTRTKVVFSPVPSLALGA